MGIPNRSATRQHSMPARQLICRRPLPLSGLRSSGMVAKTRVKGRPVKGRPLTPPSDGRKALTPWWIFRRLVRRKASEGALKKSRRSAGLRRCRKRVPRSKRVPPRPAAPLRTNLDFMTSFSAELAQEPTPRTYDDLDHCLRGDFLFNTPLTSEEMLGLDEYGSFMSPQKDTQKEPVVDADTQWIDEMLRLLPPSLPEPEPVQCLCAPA